MSITLEQVLKAYEYADSHPHKFLRGTTNWCAAVAHALNAEQPAPVATFGADTVVCRRYQLEQSPGQNFYHYDLEPVYGSVPVTISELISMAESAPVAVVIPRKLNPESLYPDQSDCGWNDCIDEVCRLNGIKP